LRGTFGPVGNRERRFSSNDFAAGFWRLGGIGAQKTIFQRSPIKTADDGIHFFLIRGFNESEAFGLLGFRVTDYLDRISDKVL